MRPAALVRCRCAGAAARALAAYEKLSCCVRERSSCARYGLVFASTQACLSLLGASLAGNSCTSAARRPCSRAESKRVCRHCVHIFSKRVQSSALLRQTVQLLHARKPHAPSAQYLRWVGTVNTGGFAGLVNKGTLQIPCHLVSHEVREIQVDDDALPALQGSSQALTLVLVLCLTVLRYDDDI